MPLTCYGFYLLQDHSVACLIHFPLVSSPALGYRPHENLMKTMTAFSRNMHLCTYQIWHMISGASQILRNSLHCQKNGNKNLICVTRNELRILVEDNRLEYIHLPPLLS